MDEAVVHLMEENAILRERIAQLEHALAPQIEIPVTWGLTATESRVFAHLKSRAVATKSSLALAVYSHLGDEAPAESVLESHISRLKRKIEPFGYRIESERFLGYRLIGPTKEAS